MPQPQPEPAAAQTVAGLPAQLNGGGPSERAAAYAALEGTRDVELAAGCVKALLDVLGKPASTVNALEARRGMLVLAQIATLDPARIGSEYFRDMRYLSVHAKGNALDLALSAPPEQWTKEVVRTLAVSFAADAAIFVKGFAPYEAAGTSWMEYHGTIGSQDNAISDLLGMMGLPTSDDRKVGRAIMLLLDLLREARSELAEGEVAGVWWLLDLLGDWNINPTHVLLNAVQAGIMGLAIEELRTVSPADWVSVARNPSGKFGAVLNTVRGAGALLPPEHMHLIAATPGLLDVFLDGLKAFEAAAAPKDANHTAVMGIATGLYNKHLYFFEFGKVNRTAVRGAASSIRYVLDNPLPWLEDMHCNTNTWTVRYHLLASCMMNHLTARMRQGYLAASVYGRDEDDSVMALRQRDVDDGLQMCLRLLDGSVPVNLRAEWSDVVLNISISDNHKLLLLKSPALWELMKAGLFTDPEHPRGPNGSAPLPDDLRAAAQRSYTEALLQLALFPSGREAIQEEASVMKALEEVADHGMSPEAREHAEGALLAVSDKEMQQASSGGGPKHVMLSYQVSTHFHAAYALRLT